MNLGLPLMPSLSVSQSNFLNALACKNKDHRPPVWLMRQAGRYLPEYQVIRQKYSLEEMFRTPELIYKITKQPIDILGVDAAILFADILHIPLTLGFDVTFPGKGGPLVTPAIETPADFLHVHPRPVKETLDFVAQGIKMIKEDTDVPLIGFCGGPFTVMTYLMGKKIKRWLYSHPKEVLDLLQIITTQSITYLQMQIKAGVDAIQIFDSWANLLSREEFCHFALPFLKQIIDAIDLPVIIFSRASSLFVAELVSIRPNGISFDWSLPPDELRKRIPETIAVQGNLDPEILYAPPQIIQKETQKMLERMQGDPGYIVNLGHGVLPDIPVDHVRAFVDTVKSFSPCSNRGHGA